MGKGGSAAGGDGGGSGGGEGAAVVGLDGLAIRFFPFFTIASDSTTSGGRAGYDSKRYDKFSCQAELYPWQVLRRTDAKSYEKKVRN